MRRNGCKILLILTLLVSVVGCNACKNAAERHATPVNFQVEMQASSTRIFPNQTAEINLAVLSNDPKAASLEYMVKTIEVTHGSVWLTNAEEEVKDGTMLAFGKQHLIFKPAQKGGKASVKLTLISNQEVESSAILEFEVIDLQLELQAASTSIFSHQVLPISLNLSSAYQEALDLEYTLQGVEVTHGALVFESTNKAVKADDKLIFGRQTLLFKPDEVIGNEKTSATIQLTITSNKGHKNSVDLLLDINPISFQVELQPEATNIFDNQNGEVTLVLSSAIEEAAHLSYAIKTIEITNGRLFFKDKDQLVQASDKLAFGSQQLLFKPNGVTGGDKVLATIQLTIISNEGYESSADLALEVKPIIFQVELKRCSSYDERGIFSYQDQEINLKIFSNSYAKFKKDYIVKAVEFPFGSLSLWKTGKEVMPGSRLESGHYGQKLIFNPRGILGDVTIKIIVINEEGVERNASISFSVEPFIFKVALHAHHKGIFSHQKANINLRIDSYHGWKANQLGYTVKALEMSFGTLVFADTDQVVQVGSKLKAGLQSLAFKPMGQIGEATIKLTVVSGDGSETSANLIINVLPISFKVKAVAKDRLSYFTAPTYEESQLLKQNGMAVIVINIKELSHAYRSLDSGPWKVVSWSFSDGIQRKLINARGKQLTQFPLSWNGTRLYVDLGEKMRMGTDLRLKLHVEGAQKTMREAEVALGPLQVQLIAERIKEFMQTIWHLNAELNCYFPFSTAAQPQTEVTRRLNEEASEQIDKFKAVYMQLAEREQWWKSPIISSLPDEAIKNVNRIIKEIMPKLIEKKLRLDSFHQAND